MHFPEGNYCILIVISLEFVPNDPIYRSMVVQVMAWRRRGDKPLTRPMMIKFMCIKHICLTCVNSLRPRPNRRHFADDIFKCIFENGNELILPRISLKFVPKVRINNIPALVQIMAWRRPGDKPLSEPMMVRLPTHICVTRPQWVKSSRASGAYMRQ